MAAPILLDDIATLLVTAGIGQMTDDTKPWMIFKGYLQERPDQAICLYETAGPEPDPTYSLDTPDLQVRVRGLPDGYQAARAMMKQIFDALHGSVPTAGYVYVFAKNSGVVPLGQDENRRPHMAMNFRCMKNTV